MATHYVRDVTMQSSESSKFFSDPFDYRGDPEIATPAPKAKKNKKKKGGTKNKMNGDNKAEGVVPDAPDNSDTGERDERDAHNVCDVLCAPDRKS